MSKIERIRILNLNYNHNTIKIDDETFDLGGENTLISLRNGGGKSVLVQMVVSLFVNRTYRDFGDRPFKSYFTTNRPTFLMTEWRLDNGVDRFLAGMMVRKSQKEDNDVEELEMYTFTGSYSKACRYDLDNIPIIKTDGARKILKGFGECRQLLEDISKNGNGDFRLYDMSSRYGRTQYFAVLKQYQINHKEWESIIWKVNQKESGLSELFQNARDEKELVENWFLRPIEDNLNQDKNKMDEFRKLTFQFVEQYRSNQSRIQRKGRIEQYFEDTKPLKKEIDDYVQKDANASECKTEIVLYAWALQKEVDRLVGEIEERHCKMDGIQRNLSSIIYEELSFQIYQCEDEKEEVVLKRAAQEVEITRQTALQRKLARKILAYELHQLYQELAEFQVKKAEIEEKLQVLLQESETSRDEIEKIGYQLYQLYVQKAEKLETERAVQKTLLSCTEKDTGEKIEEQKRQEDRIRELSGTIGALKSQVQQYDGTEETFNKKFDCDLQRNILGFYEDGFLDICKKDMEEELQKQKNERAKEARKISSLEQSDRNLVQETAECEIQQNDLEHQLREASVRLTDLEQQKRERVRIMKYVGVEDGFKDRKDIILAHIGSRIREVDIARSNLIREKTEKEKHLRQLKEGKTTEIPEHIRNSMEQNGIEIVYGMEWLAKNGRSVEENADMVKRNPFIPYAVFMEKAVFERFRRLNEELYTSFPIPIIVKEELEQELEHSDGRIASFGNLHFYIMFNTHLLDRAELKKMLDEIQKQVEGLENAIEDKEKDLEVYRDYRMKIENQSFTMLLYQQTEKEIADLKEKGEQLEKRLQEIRRRRSDIAEEKEKAAAAMEKITTAIRRCEERAESYVELCKKYRQYETDRSSLQRVTIEKEETVKKQEELSVKLEELRNQIAGLKAQQREYADKIAAARQKAEEYKNYETLDGKICVQESERMEPALLEARFRALTKEISDDIEELQEEQKQWQKRVRNKKEELDEKNEENQIPETEYRELICSREQYTEWKSQKKRVEKELNRANDENTKLGESIGSLNTKLKIYLENLKKETGYEQAISRTAIVDTDFEKRKTIKKHEAETLNREIKKLADRKAFLDANVAAVDEYTDEKPELEGDALETVRGHIPDVRTEEKEVLKSYQKEIRKKMSDIAKQLENCRVELAELIRNLAAQSTYAEDYFRKTFHSLLTQTDNPQNLLKQYEINRMAYENQLEKLKIDLAHMDDERKNLEMMFLEYIEQVNANIGMIDKNSTINIRDRSLKMLRIQVADWESEKEHFRLKLHDYFENMVKAGIHVIEKNENLTEYLGRMITTRKLYDDVVGIQNVKIKLYKVEEEREVPISWSEVSANSGGEGFLSAFIILTCLLSYMRRDEADLFTSGEEGKVLIMDNPFAQTNAEHLLKPLMEMAKKTNTQLICLSGLGGDSIYNRFDNIYVVKLQESSIRNGVRRMESTHIKGEEIRRLVLADFKMEQMELANFM